MCRTVSTHEELSPAILFSADAVVGAGARSSGASGTDGGNDDCRACGETEMRAGLLSNVFRHGSLISQSEKINFC